ncbi:MAG: LacI family DNA-binding transcriptional regulator [Pseudomonadota bacterium]
MSRHVFKKRANLRDVARFAGVSVATVSRVLNSPEKVSAQTREKVDAAIAELKFVPSAAARAINSGRSRMVAALLPTLDNSIYARLVNGLESRLALDGLSLIVAQTGEDGREESERARQMVDIGAEALIVAGVTHDESFFDLIDRAQIPAIAISYFERGNRLPTVGYDNAEAVRVAATHLADLGHRHIAVFHGPAATNDRTRRRLEALRSIALDLDFRYYETSLSMEGGHEAVAGFLGSDSQCTGIICFSDVIAYGTLGALQRRAIEVPRDISVMGIENLPGSEFTCPSLTSVRLRVEEMGIKAAECVSTWLETAVRPEPVYLKSELVRRESTARHKPDGTGRPGRLSRS